MSPDRRSRLLVVIGTTAAVIGAVLVGRAAGGHGTGTTAAPTPPSAVSTAPSASVSRHPKGDETPRHIRTPSPSHRPGPAAAGRPVELSIPRLGVRAPVDAIGLSGRDGRTLEPPNSPSRVGWWRDGPRPGDPRGTVIIVGHTLKIRGVVGTGDGALGRAPRLEPGDPIQVTTTRGVLRYRVTEVTRNESYANVARGIATIDNRTYPGGRLVLITCWYDGSRFTGNTLVFAKPV